MDLCLKCIAVPVVSYCCVNHSFLTSGCSGFGSVFLSKTLDKERVAIKRMPHVTDKQKWINVDEVYFLKNSVDCNNIVGYNAAYLMRDEIWVR